MDWLLLTPAPTVTTPNSRDPISGIHTRLARVLVVDDDARAAQSLCRALSDEFVAQATSSPDDALASLLLETTWYDVILCDVMTPGTTGIDLHRRLHDVRPTQAVRVVFMTGGVSDPRLRAALDGLPNLVLDKPVDVADLRELIRRRVLGSPSSLRKEA